MASTDRIDVRLPALPASIPAIRHAVLAFAEAHAYHDPHAVALAVSEGASNAVLHAYPAGEAGDLLVTAGLEAGGLVVTVRDWGAGMRPRPDSPGLGLGLPTIATLAGGFDIEAADGAGTLLRMHFPPAAAQVA